MDTFAKNLRILMEEDNKSPKELAEKLGLEDPSIIYGWLNGKGSVLLPTAIRIADFFDCSLDYLFGLDNYYEKTIYKESRSFDEQFKKVLTELKTTQYKLIKDRIVSSGNIYSWLNRKNNPHIESIKKLAVYFGVSMDYIAGRED